MEKSCLYFHPCGRRCWGPTHVPWPISISCTWTQPPPAAGAVLPEASLAVRASVLQWGGERGSWYTQEQPESVDEGVGPRPSGRGAQRCVLCLPLGFLSSTVKPQLPTMVTGLITGPWMAPLPSPHFPTPLLTAQVDYLPKILSQGLLPGDPKLRESSRAEHGSIHYLLFIYLFIYLF